MNPRDTMFSMCTIWPIPREVIPRIKLASILSSITFETNVHLYRVDIEGDQRKCTPLKADKVRGVIDYIQTQTNNYLDWTVDRIFYDFPYRCIGIEIVREQEPEPKIALNWRERTPGKRFTCSEQEFAQIIIWTLEHEEISALQIRQKFRMGNRVKAIMLRLYDAGIISQEFANQPRAVLPLSISDISDEIIELLERYNITNADIVNAIEKRKCSH